MPSLQKRLLKRAARVLEDADDDLKFYVAAEEEVKKSSNTKWIDLAEPDEAPTLSQI